MDVVGAERTCQCFSDPDNIFSVVYSWFILCFVFVLVHSVILVATIIIIRTVIIASRARTEQVEGMTRKATVLYCHGTKVRSKREKQTVLLMLMTSIAFLVLTVPAWIMDFVYSIHWPGEKPHEQATYLFFYHAAQKLFITNGAVNFFLYCLGGSKFRSDLRRVLSCLPLIRGSSFLSAPSPKATGSSSSHLIPADVIPMQ